MIDGYHRFDFKENGRMIFSWIETSWMKDGFVGFIRHIEDNLASSIIIKDSRSVEAGICKFGEHNLFIKKYNDRGIVHRLRHILKTPRAYNALRVFSHLRRNNVQFFLPFHIAALCKRKPGIGQRFSYLIQEAVDDLIPTLEIVRAASSSDAKREQLMENLAKTLAQMHSAGIFHGDAKLTNFLFKNTNGGYICGMWDFDVARIVENIPQACRERDLARVIASYLKISDEISERNPNASRIDNIVKKYEDFSGIKINNNSIMEKARKF